MQWLKIYNRKEYYSNMVDKYEAKQYIKDLIGDKHLIPTIGIYDSFQEINFDSLPQQFVLKTTHDSGTVFICKEKNKFDFKTVERKVKKMMKKNLFWRTREWPYKNVKPRIIIEQFICEEDLSQCPEFKVFCFNGQAKLVLVCQGEANGAGRTNDFFDANFNHYAVDTAYPQFKGSIAKPPYYQQLLEIAETLSTDIPALRVDFYCLKNSFYIGEMTFYHCGGFCRFNPKEFDLLFGDLLDLTSHKQ